MNSAAANAQSTSGKPQHSLLALSIAVCVLTACASERSKPSAPQLPPPAGLHAALDDAAILQLFALSIDQATVELVHGKDGVQRSYVFADTGSGEKEVSVLRSLVSGLAVRAEGTQPAGRWLIGFPSGSHGGEQ